MIEYGLNTVTQSVMAQDALKGGLFRNPDSATQNLCKFLFWVYCFTNFTCSAPTFKK